MHSKRQRTSKACDQCRKARARCQWQDESEKVCARCAASQHRKHLASARFPLVEALASGAHILVKACTYKGHSEKRGPPKGYLSSLIQRVQRAEGLLGALVSSPDPRATSLLSDMSTDPLASSIIARIPKRDVSSRRSAHDDLRLSVDALSHPTSSEKQRIRKRCRDAEERPSIDEQGHLVFKFPSEIWQRYVNFRLAAEARARDAPELRTAAADSYAPHRGACESELVRACTGVVSSSTRQPAAVARNTSSINDIDSPDVAPNGVVERTVPNHKGMNTGGDTIRQREDLPSSHAENASQTSTVDAGNLTIQEGDSAGNLLASALGIDSAFGGSRSLTDAEEGAPR